MALVRRTSPPATATEPTTVLTPQELIAELDLPAPERRRLAALGLHGIPEAIPALLERVGFERDSAVRDAVLTTLAAFDNEAVVNGLVPHLSSDDAALRTAVAEALSSMPETTPAVIPELLDDPDHDVRIMTAMVLADLKYVHALGWLEDMIRTDPHPNVVTAAIDALLPLATAEHVEVLETAQARFPADPFLRFTVASALPRLRQAGS